MALTCCAQLFKSDKRSALSDAELISIEVNPSPQVLALSSSSYTTGEGGPAIVTVNRTGGSAGTVSVDYFTANISASAGADYTATSGTLIFTTGETAKVLSVPILNDTTPDPNETFRVSLTNPSASAGLGTPTTATVTIVDDDTPSLSGQWGPLIPWQTVPIHMHLLPTGKVMFWDRHEHAQAQGWDGNPWVWDPATQVFTMLPHLNYDIFCSGHTFMADGRLMVTGGHHMANDVGESTASIYDPLVNSWTALPNMNAGRWYPTNTTLANGDILVLAGTTNGYGNVNLMPQVWQTSSGTWRNLTAALQQGNYPTWPDYYPFMYMAPNGKVFNAGPQQTSRYLDTSGTGAWTDVANSSLIYRDYGSSVMYADGKVLIIGGNPREPDPNASPTILPSATAEVIDLSIPTPAWRPVSPMSIGRRHLNTTLLPDGKVLVIGGSSFAGFDDPLGKVLYAEMWDPETEAWTIMAGYTRYRGYHSNALLLLDGRVLIAGGGHPNPPSGAEQNAEIYSPPYLFKGARPTITSAPIQVGYGQTFFIETPTPQNIANVNWIRLSSVTHAFNQNQRINHLSFSQTSGGLLVTTPSSANLCPPGHYMLFILNSNGVPSVARIIQIGPSSTVPTIQFDSSTYNVTEGAGGATITITRTGDSSSSISVSYATSNGTATVSADYTSTSGTFTFNAGEVSKSFTVPIRDDALYEINETINLTLSNPGGGATLGTPSTAMLTIADNDPQPTLSINNVSIQEGNSGITSLTFTVSLSAASGLSTTVHYATADGTATTVDNDYLAISDTVLTISAGSVSAIITVPINGDTKVEANETFFANLSNAVNATITVGQGTGIIINDDVTMTVQLSAPSYNAGEADQRINITVTRSGNTSGTATVNYSTSDTAGLNNCNVFNGIASSRCDYATSVGTLRFAAGETSKTISIPLVNDSYAEGNESFTITLSNPSGATLQSPTTATITIVDNETVNGANPIDSVTFFVRQHYIDFLGREPDPIGYQGWQDILNNCGVTVAQPCDRIEVSSDFFRSEEFQTRGYFIYRFYSAVGKIPLYPEFMPDFAKVSGFLSAQQLEDNKVAFVNEFMTRQDFQTRYGSLSDPTAYVTALLQTIGLPNHPGRQTWIIGLGNGTLTRAQVLRSLTESGEVYQKYYTEAFVIMQYFGYLRRSADVSYLSWIKTMNDTGGDYRIMINGFLNSAEYRLRFGN